MAEYAVLRASIAPPYSANEVSKLDRVRMACLICRKYNVCRVREGHINVWSECEDSLERADRLIDDGWRRLE